MTKRLLSAAWNQSFLRLLQLCVVFCLLPLNQAARKVTFHRTLLLENSTKLDANKKIIFWRRVCQDQRDTTYAFDEKHRSITVNKTFNTEVQKQEFLNALPLNVQGMVGKEYLHIRQKSNEYFNFGCFDMTAFPKSVYTEMWDVLFAQAPNINKVTINGNFQGEIPDRAFTLLSKCTKLTIIEYVGDKDNSETMSNFLNALPRGIESLKTVCMKNVFDSHAVTIRSILSGKTIEKLSLTFIKSTPYSLVELLAGATFNVSKIMEVNSVITSPKDFGAFELLHLARFTIKSGIDVIVDGHRLDAMPSDPYGNVSEIKVDYLEYANNFRQKFGEVNFYALVEALEPPVNMRIDYVPSLCDSKVLHSGEDYDIYLAKYMRSDKCPLDINVEKIKHTAVNREKTQQYNVIVKIFHNIPSTSAASEIEILGRLQYSNNRHPNIPFYLTDRLFVDFHVICYDYHSKFNLKTWFAEEAYSKQQMGKQRTSQYVFPEYVKIIANDILKALAYIHRNGIIHRNVNLENIFFDGEVAILVNYGDAVQAKKAKGAVGERPYRSPEMERNEEYDGRTDVWSFGVVLHLLMTCDWPFQNRENVNKLIENLEAYEKHKKRIEKLQCDIAAAKARRESTLGFERLLKIEKDKAPKNPYLSIGFFNPEYNLEYRTTRTECSSDRTPIYDNHALILSLNRFNADSAMANVIYDCLNKDKSERASARKLLITHFRSSSIRCSKENPDIFEYDSDVQSEDTADTLSETESSSEEKYNESGEMRNNIPSARIRKEQSK